MAEVVQNSTHQHFDRICHVIASFLRWHMKSWDVTDVTNTTASDLFASAFQKQRLEKLDCPDHACGVGGRRWMSWRRVSTCLLRRSPPLPSPFSPFPPLPLSHGNPPQLSVKSRPSQSMSKALCQRGGHFRLSKRQLIGWSVCQCGCRGYLQIAWYLRAVTSNVSQNIHCLLLHSYLLMLYRRYDCNVLLWYLDI